MYIAYYMYIPSLNIDKSCVNGKNTFNNSKLLMRHENLSDKNCLIIEDSLCMIKLHTAYCKSIGFQNIDVCTTIRNFYQYLEKHDIHKIDFILIDFLLDELIQTGAGLISILRIDHKYRGIIIGVSAAVEKCCDRSVLRLHHHDLEYLIPR